MVRSVVELDCMIGVAGYTSTALYSRRVAVASFVADRCCKMEDTLDPCSIRLLETGYYNNLGMYLDNLVFPVDLTLLVGLVYTCHDFELL